MAGDRILLGTLPKDSKKQSTPVHMWSIPVYEHLEHAQYTAEDRKLTSPKGSKKQGTPIHMWCIPVSEHLEQAQYMGGGRRCTLPNGSQT